MAEAGAGDSSSPDVDRDFEPSAELLIHDYDDEATMEEEENQSGSGDNEELDDLQKESDMPIEAVLAMYGYSSADAAMPGAENQESRSSTSEEEILNNHDLTLDKEEVARDILKDDDGSEASTIDELIENVDPNATSRLIINGSFVDPVDIFDGEDDEDEDYLPTLDEEMWKKTIQVGEDFQADIPEISSESINNISDSSAAGDERLLWDPEVLVESEVVKYLNELMSSEVKALMPDGAEMRDDEQALYTLLQSDFNVDEAVRRKKLQTTPPTDPLSLWSEDECQNFESGLRVYGKNFFAIHQNKLRTRSVGELVQFYYFWKKTERREAFCNRGRIEKKKPSVNPGITDYTDRFIDKTDSDDDSTSSLDCACDPTITSMFGSDHHHHYQPAHHGTNTENGSTPLDDLSSNLISAIKPTTETASTAAMSEGYALNNVPNTLPVLDIISGPAVKRPHADSAVTPSEVTAGYGEAIPPTENIPKRLRVDPVSYPSAATAEVGN